MSTQVTGLKVVKTITVDLEHRGWEALGERAAGMRDGYDEGWDAVLAGYVARV